MSGGALAGLRVIDAASLYAAPFVATLLADHGAEVIKVEPPGGDAYRHYPNRMWPLLARGKRSVVLDLGDAAGCDQLRRLVRDADVLIVNLPPTTLAKRGLDYHTLAAANPGLIMVSTTGFGLDGPYMDRPGNGTLGEAYAGLTHMTGDPNGPPVLASVPLGDAITGIAGAFGVLAACYHKLAHGGSGQLIDLNPLDVLLHVAGPVHTEYDGHGEPPNRQGSRLRGSTVRNVFATADGRWVAISASTPRHVSDLANLAGHDEWDDDGVPRGDVEAALRRWTSAHSCDEVVEALVSRRLPVAPIQNARDVRSDPQVVSRDALITVVTAEHGPVRSPAPAPRLTGTPAPVRTRTPDVGEHAAEVLECGSPW